MRLARKPVRKFYHSYVATNIVVGAWTEIIAALGVSASAIEIFNGSGSTIKLATGGLGSEVEIPYFILPGGSSIMLPIEFAKGVRLSARAEDVAAAAGQLILNFFG